MGEIIQVNPLKLGNQGVSNNWCKETLPEKMNKIRDKKVKTFLRFEYNYERKVTDLIIHVNSNYIPTRFKTI